VLRALRLRPRRLLEREQANVEVANSPQRFAPNSTRGGTRCRAIEQGHLGEDVSNLGTFCLMDVSAIVDRQVLRWPDRNVQMPRHTATAFQALEGEHASAAET
jgi:hypothetical protein